MTDSLGLAQVALGLPEQMAAAGAAARACALPDGPFRSVLLAGMGGSGIGGDVAAALGQRSSAVPIVVAKDHDLPHWVGADTLVVATSFSGNTAETLDLVAAARRCGAGLVLCSAGGRLAALGAEWRVAHVGLDGSIPMPRAAIGAVSVAPLVVLSRLGLIEPIDTDLDNCIAHLRTRVRALAAPSSPADKVAARIGLTFPVIYGAGPLGAVAAYRFKCQVNENAKAPAFWSPVPEANHNELAGWGQHGDVTRQLITTVHLRHSFEPTRVSQSYSYMHEVHDEVTAAVIEMRAEGDTPLAQLFDLIAFADFVSLFMASRQGLDPGPIPALDELKARLG